MHVYAGIPLYAFKGMTEYHTYYTNAVKNGEQGLHMSYGDAIAWGSFPPMVNDLALKIIKAGGNAYINAPNYQSEMQILQEVKDDADAVDQYGFFEDNPNPADTTKNYYAMHYLFAVSYTHLDVYKRQPLRSLHSRINIVTLMLMSQ